MAMKQTKTTLRCIRAAHEESRAGARTGWLSERDHVVLRLVPLEVLIRSAPNLAQVNAISFLT